MTEPFKEKDGDLEMIVTDKVNTFDLTDNCYYVTAAKLAKTDVASLVKKSELMQIKGGAPTKDIVTIFKAAGVPHTIHTTDSLFALKAKMVELGGTSDRRFGVAFVRGNSTGHMVVGEYQASNGATRFRDYQARGDGPDASTDLATGVTFHLFY